MLAITATRAGLTSPCTQELESCFKIEINGVSSLFSMFITGCLLDGIFCKQHRYHLAVDS